MTSHLVVDGSNIATEGRKVPSLAQLTDAVEQFLADRPHDLVTVICDASFPNRIDASETKRYEQLLDEGQLITPPAGAIGRGDAFILQVATKGGAAVLSNDSFQEFHGQHEWLFDEGRLVGGKPVTGVGWVFVDRVPVRGPTSRKSVRDASRKEPSEPAVKKRSRKAAAPKAKSSEEPESAKAGSSTEAGSPRKARASRAKKPATRTRSRTATANKSDDPPSSDPALDADNDDSKVTESTRKRRARKAASVAGGSTTPDQSAAPSSDGDGSGPANPTEVYERFAAAHPVGSEVTATVVSFGSHGAYASVGDVSCYVPLKLLGDPPPRTVKDVLTIDEERAFVVAALHVDTNGVDLGLAPPKPVRRTRKKSTAKKRVAKKTTAKKTVAKKTVAKKTVANKSAAKKTSTPKTVTRKRTIGKQSDQA